MICPIDWGLILTLHNAGSRGECAPGILIVDDHPLIRRTVRALLEGHDLDVCGEAADGKIAIEKATDQRPDVVVLDIMMPLMNGIEAAQEIRRILPATKIVFLTMYEYAAFEARTALWSHGYVQKSAAGSRLVPMLKALLAEPRIAYPWQQLVRDAFAARPDILAAKIRMAETAVAARSSDQNQPDPEERFALNEALRTLKQLLTETKKPEEQQPKKYGVA